MNFFKKLFLKKANVPLENINNQESENDELKQIKDYIHGGSDFFYENFYNTTQYNNLILWVDWREEDASIVAACENILQTGQLEASYTQADDDIGFEVIITYKGKQHKITYKQNAADRDTTIITEPVTYFV